MTIIGFVVFAIACCVILPLVYQLLQLTSVSNTGKKAAMVAATVLILAAVLFYYNGTASGRRSLTDQKSELAIGLDREIDVLTLDGKVIDHYEGKIDIEGNDGGYVVFDYNGKRYTYYNAIVRSIADIE